MDRGGLRWRRELSSSSSFFSLMLLPVGGRGKGRKGASTYLCSSLLLRPTSMEEAEVGGRTEKRMKVSLRQEEEEDQREEGREGEVIFPPFSHLRWPQKSGRRRRREGRREGEGKRPKGKKGRALLTIHQSGSHPCPHPHPKPRCRYFIPPIPLSPSLPPSANPKISSPQIFPGMREVEVEEEFATGNAKERKGRSASNL